jgi:hypothetical protein
MTPRQRLSEKIDGLPRWQRWLINTGATASAAIVLIAAIKPIWQPVAKDIMVTALDSVYVRQQSYGAKNTVDSLKHEHELEKIDAKLARVDSSVSCLRRKKPDWCQ